jgi:hypothetical protein
MSLEYMLGYMQGRRGQLRFRQNVSDEYNAGYLKGFALYEGDVMILRQLVNRYNK